MFGWLADCKRVPEKLNQVFVSTPVPFLHADSGAPLLRSRSGSMPGQWGLLALFGSCHSQPSLRR